MVEKIKSRLTTSVAKKIIMSMAGLFLCSFLVVHLFGNLLLFRNDGGALFNAYSDFMETNIFIRILEIVLFGGILIHVLYGILLTIRNKESRPVRYAVNDPGANSTWFSRNMGLTGAVIFLFLIVHIKNFMIDQRFMHAYSSMYDSVKLTFGNPLYALFYVVTVFWLGLHLNHGFQSAFQSVGFNHPRYTQWLKYLGTFFSVVITIGFLAMPIYFYLRQV